MQSNIDGMLFVFENLRICQIYKNANAETSNGVTENWTNILNENHIELRMSMQKYTLVLFKSGSLPSRVYREIQESKKKKNKKKKKKNKKKKRGISNQDNAISEPNNVKLENTNISTLERNNL